MRLGEREIGSCVVIECDMDALALLDEATRLGAGEIVLFAPLHREGRRRGLYERLVEPANDNPLPSRLAGELWANLTGSLKLVHYEAALRRLYSKPFRVVECEAGGGGCSGLLQQWIEARCKAS